MDRRDAGHTNRDILRWYHHRSPRPYYLFINYFDVHDPYLVPAHHASRFGDVPPWRLGRIQSAEIKVDFHLRLSAADTEAYITSYDNCLAYLDESVGGLLESLSRLRGWENTVVIITSDHGEGSGEHGSYNHGDNLYRESLHVPLIIFGPHIPSGLRIPHVVGIQELFATVLQLAGMDNPPFERASLQRYWRPGYQPGDFDEFVVSELSTLPSLISVTTPEWQYLHDSQGKAELYHWVSDPGERFNLAQSAEDQEVVKNLQIQLRKAVMESLPPWRGTGYLSALGESEHTLANAARSSPGPDASSAHLPGFPIGTSQAFFPRRAFTSTPPSTDQELLRSLPYH
jgi:arylsulfatase A-like enzyme